MHCVLVSGDAEYLCTATKESDTHHCLEFLAAIKDEYERGGYREKQELSEFEDFIESEMVSAVQHLSHVI